MRDRALTNVTTVPVTLLSSWPQPEAIGPRRASAERAKRWGLHIIAADSGSSWPAPAEKSAGPSAREAAAALRAIDAGQKQALIAEAEREHLAGLAEQRRRRAELAEETRRLRHEAGEAEADTPLTEVERRRLINHRARRQREASEAATLRLREAQLCSENERLHSELRALRLAAGAAAGSAQLTAAPAEAPAGEAAAVDGVDAADGAPSSAAAEEASPTGAPSASLAEEAIELGGSLPLSASMPLSERSGIGESSGAALVLGSEDLRMGGPIAEGEFAEVFKGLLWGQRVAVKRLKRREASTDESLMREMEHEVAVLASLRHPNILTLIGHHTPAGGEPCLVLEYLEGTVYDEIRSGALATPWALLRLLGELASACAYLHSHLIIHRDLKPPNVLCDASHRCKLADFGTALVLSSPSDRSLSESIGTALYMAPEVEAAGPYGLPADAFAYGALCFELFMMLETGEDYYEGFNLFGGLEALREPLAAGGLPERPSLCDDDAVWELVCGCLSSEPDARPAFADVARRVGEAVQRKAEGASDSAWLA